MGRLFGRLVLVFRRQGRCGDGFRNEWLSGGLICFVIIFIEEDELGSEFL